MGKDVPAQLSLRGSWGQSLYPLQLPSQASQASYGTVTVLMNAVPSQALCWACATARCRPTDLWLRGMTIPRGKRDLCQFLLKVENTF